MQIDRHNYEEYFILYMDNELSAAGRRMVESFVQNNPHLKEELESLIQYKLEPDTQITFDGKEELLRMNGTPMMANPDHETSLFLYADNELNDQDRAAVESLISTQPAVQKEWERIQQTKLRADESIVFPDKESLYRREEKVRPIIWWRFAAAAVVLIAAGLITNRIVNTTGKPTGTEPVVAVADGSKPSGVAPSKTNLPDGPDTKNTVAVPLNVPNEPVVTDNSGSETTVSVNKKEQTTGTNNAKAALARQQVKQNTRDQKKPIVPVPDQTPKQDIAIAETNTTLPSNNLAKPEKNPYYAAGIKNNDAIASTQQLPDVKNPENALTNRFVTTQPGKTSDIVQASFPDDRKNNKLRGLFRKVARTFEKRTNTEPSEGNDRLLIAGLSFKMK
ncbi:MAG: hypothetical protein NTW29_07790 [Bacteroidetes bacterium]|nr:hypothetical protein [Bacteroidota bacterium]